VRCAAGFYVRSLAHDLGTRLGLGAHLIALRRTRSGDYTLDDAMPLDGAERHPEEAARRVIPLAQMLPGLPSVTLTPEGVRLAMHGRDLGSGDFENRAGLGIGDSGFESQSPNPDSRPLHIRLLGPAGDLVGIATPAEASGALHPSVVLV